VNRIFGVIVAGGAAGRAGGEKALLPFAGGTLIDAVIARVQMQVSLLALNIPAARIDDYHSRYPHHPLLFDSNTDRMGPLAGVIAGLDWLRSAGSTEWLATFPCDTPFLPRDLVAQLMSQACDAPVFAHHENRLHGICAVWPLSCLEQLRAGIESGKLRSLHSAMDALGGSTCHVEAGAHAFFNINTQSDLIRAEELAREL
jgi:molybdopterin-guanine dinucleotide biosynthesis protein A